MKHMRGEMSKIKFFHKKIMNKFTFRMANSPNMLEHSNMSMAPPEKKTIELTMELNTTGGGGKKGEVN